EAEVADRFVVVREMTRGFAETEDSFGVAGIGVVGFEKAVVGALPVAGLHIVVADVGVFAGEFGIERERRGRQVGGKGLVGGGHVEALDLAGAVAGFFW